MNGTSNLPALERKGTVSLAPDPCPPSVYPCIVYADVEAGVSHLTRKLGGMEHLMVRSEATGEAHHAEVRMGVNGFVLIDRASDANPARSSHVYIYVKNVAKHYEAAVESGATIQRKLEDRGPAGMSYACVDPEGNKFTFGNYLP